MVFSCVQYKTQPKCVERIMKINKKLALFVLVAISLVALTSCVVVVDRGYYYENGQYYRSGGFYFDSYQIDEIDILY